MTAASRRLVVGLLVGALAGLVGTGAGSSSAQTMGGLEISPARVENDTDAPRADVPITITNRDQTERVIDVVATTLSHDLDGNPTYGSAPSFATLSPSGSLRVPANTSVTVVLSVELPPGTGGRYAAVLASMKPGGASGSITQRAASLVLLRGKRPWDERIEIRGVELAPMGGRRYRVSAVVANTGNVHQKPTGTIELVRDGAVIGTVPLTPQNILPSASRRLSGVWEAPAGTSESDLDGVTANVELGGPSPTSGSAPAKIVEPVDPSEGNVEPGDGPSFDDVPDDSTTTSEATDGSTTSLGAPGESTSGPTDSGHDTSVPPALAAAAVIAMLLAALGVGAVLSSRRTRSG